MNTVAKRGSEAEKGNPVNERKPAPKEGRENGINEAPGRDWPICEVEVRQQSALTQPPVT